MKSINTVKVNFKGGIIPPRDLYNILVAATQCRMLAVRFGLRQQLLMDVEVEELEKLTAELNALHITYELNKDEFPNITSSYPAEEAFISNTWLTEKIYKEVLDSFEFAPRLKVNLCDSNQSFTPLLTGNINWVASPAEPGFWHLFIRFPKTNIVYEWKEEAPSASLAAMTSFIEETITQNGNRFYDNELADGEELYELVRAKNFNTKPYPAPLPLPPFNLPYYEGLNRYQDKYWLGIYRRDELFAIRFLMDACLLCINTGVTQLCTTPWKTVMLKGIEEKNRNDWNDLMDKYQINVRHAANELNFQVEDNNPAALKLKQHLVKYLNNDDTRTFGVCIGIKTRKKSEVFCSILVKRRPLVRFGKWEFFYMYDILCAKKYNPNERTDFVFSRDNPKFVVAEQLRRAVLSYYEYIRDPSVPPRTETIAEQTE